VVFGERLCFCGGFVSWVAFCRFGAWGVWLALMVSDCHLGWVGIVFIG
jgi:hypothetical protein